MLGLLLWIIPVLVIRTQNLYVSYEKSLRSCGGHPLPPCSGADGFPFPDLLTAFTVIDSASESGGTTTLFLTENITYILDPKKTVANRTFDSFKNRTLKRSLVVKGESQQGEIRKIIWNTRLTVHVPESLLWENIYFTSEGQHNGKLKNNKDGEDLIYLNLKISTKRPKVQYLRLATKQTPQRI